MSLTIDKRGWIYLADDLRRAPFWLVAEKYDRRGDRGERDQETEQAAIGSLMRSTFNSKK